MTVNAVRDTQSSFSGAALTKAHVGTITQKIVKLQMARISHSQVGGPNCIIRFKDL